MKFLIVSLNGTASFVALLSFVAFLFFVVNGIQLYKPAFYVLIVALIIGLFTPNKSEVDLYFNNKNKIEIK